MAAGRGAEFARGVAQQHAPKPEAPAVAVSAGRQVQRLALLGVQAPAHAGALGPRHQRGQVVGGQAEASGHRRNVQQVAQLAEGESLLRRPQQPLQRDEQRVVAAIALVRDAPGDVARVPAPVLPEDRADRRREAVDLGHHDHDVARVQRRVRRRVGEQVQQLVVQDLDLPLRAVRDVEDHRAILGRQLDRGVLAHRHQVADARLHLLEQGDAGALVEEVDPRQLEVRLRLCLNVRAVVEGIELTDEVAALPPPGRQQGVAVGVQVLRLDQREVLALAQRVAAAGRLQQLTPANEVGPVEAAGVGHGHQHLRVCRQCRDGFERLVRDVRGAEEHDAPGQPGPRAGRAQCLQEALVQHRARGLPLEGRERLERGAPQRGLPALVGRHRSRGAGAGGPGRAKLIAMPAPVLQPVAAVDLVLVEQVRQALRELQPPGRIARAQEAGHGLEAGVPGPLRQQPHQPPGQRQLVQRRDGRDFGPAQHRAVGAPDEARRQLHAARRADAVRRGQLHLEPFGHAVALDEEGLLLQRRQRVGRQPGEARLGQVLQAVALQHQQAWFEFLRHSAGVSSLRRAFPDFSRPRA